MDEYATSVLMKPAFDEKERRRKVDDFIIRLEEGKIKKSFFR
jgi:hypothetical protein